MLRCHFISILVVLLAGCTKVHGDREDEGAVPFALDTKAVQNLTQGSTFRILMYHENDRGFRQSGTYYLKEGRPELVAAELNPDDGTFIAENDALGINGVNDRVNLVLASPGVPNNDDGSFDFRPDEDDKFMVTAPDLRTVGGYGPIRLNKPLYNPRSRITFEFYKKPGVEDFTVKDSKLNIIGVHSEGETVRIYPALRQVEILPAAQERVMDLKESDHALVEVDATKNYEKFYSTSAALYVASGIYAPEQDAADYLKIPVATNILDGEYIYMSCVINQDNRDIEMRMPLNDKFMEMMPQHDYVYKVLVESDYISVVLDIFDGTSTDWKEGGTGTLEIGTLSETVQIGKWVNDGWQSAGNIDYTVG